MERVKTDPLNEKRIKAISLGALAQYGKASKSSYIVPITITPFNNWVVGEGGDTRAQVSVLDVASVRNVECLNLYDQNSSWVSGSKKIVEKIAADFKWSPPVEEPAGRQIIPDSEVKKTAVVVFLPDIILIKPELVEKVRKTVSERFKVSEVPIYVDDRPKSPQFLNLISKVETDSAKQQAFVLRKEWLVEYGKSTNSNPVVAIVVNSLSRSGGTWTYTYHLKEDILVVDTEANLYLCNVVYDNGDEKSRQTAIDLLMNKLLTEFKMP